MIIKGKKQYLFGIFLSLFVVATSLSFVNAYVPPPDFTSRKPYYVYTFLGVGDEDLNGNTVKRPNDGNVFYCEGIYVKLGSLGKWPFKIDIYAWQVGCSGFFDDPGSGYINNRVTVRYSYVGDYPLHITIYWVGGGSETVGYEYSTGGSYVQKTYNIGSKRVYAISFDHKTSPFNQPHIYLDYVVASYEI